MKECVRVSGEGFDGSWCVYWKAYGNLIEAKGALEWALGLVTSIKGKRREEPNRLTGLICQEKVK